MSQLVKSKTDRRIQRTRQSLRTALLELIKEKGYDAISIEEITERANVGRATFYLHYKDKEDLLLEDFLVSPWCLAVEWPEKIAPWLPRDAWGIELGITSGERHVIRLL